MIKKRVYGCVFAGIVLSLIFVSACRHYGPHKRMHWVMEKFTRDLDLTDAQKKQLDVYTREMKIRGRELAVPYKNIMDELRLQLSSETFDKTRLEELIAKTEAPREQFIAYFLAATAEFHGTLSAEQKKILIEKIDKMQNMQRRYCTAGR